MKYKSFILALKTMIPQLEYFEGAHDGFGFGAPAYADPPAELDKRYLFIGIPKEIYDKKYHRIYDVGLDHGVTLMKMPKNYNNYLVFRVHPTYMGYVSPKGLDEQASKNRLRNP